MLGNDTALEALKRQLVRHEGRSDKPYSDYPGERLEEALKGKVTIGVGYNLQDRGLPDDLIDDLFDRTVAEAVEECARLFDFFEDLDAVRRAVLANLMFNLGAPRLLTFRKMIAALRRRDYERAANEMRDSRWSRQVGNRAEELCRQMRTGEWPS